MGSEQPNNSNFGVNSTGLDDEQIFNKLIELLPRVAVLGKLISTATPETLGSTLATLKTEFDTLGLQLAAMINDASKSKTSLLSTDQLSIYQNPLVEKKLILQQLQLKI